MDNSYDVINWLEKAKHTVLGSLNPQKTLSTSEPHCFSQLITCLEEAHSPDKI